MKGELEQGNMLKSHAQSHASASHRAPPGSMYRLSQYLCISVSNFHIVSVLVCVMRCNFEIDIGTDMAERNFEIDIGTDMAGAILLISWPERPLYRKRGSRERESEREEPS